MSVRVRVDIPDDPHAALRQFAAAEHTSIRSLITDAIETGCNAGADAQVTYLPDLNV